MDPCFRARRGGRPKSRRMLGREAIMREMMCRDWQRSHTTRDSVNTLLCSASSILLFLSAWHFSPFNKLFFLLPFHLRNVSAFFVFFFDSTSTLAQSLTYIPPLSSHCSMPQSCIHLHACDVRDLCEWESKYSFQHSEKIPNYYPYAVKTTCQDLVKIKDWNYLIVLLH